MGLSRISNNAKVFFMPVYWRETLPGVGCLGVWKITESEDALRVMRPLSPMEEACIDGFAHEAVRRRSLAYRVLLERLLLRSVEIGHDSLGAPFIEGEQAHLSASHSGDYAAVFYSENRTVGIDIEIIRQRVRPLRRKFMTPSEMADTAWIPEKGSYSDGWNGDDAILHVYWGGKESVYKMFSSEKPLFSSEIQISPFGLEQAESKALFCRGKQNREVVLRFKRLNDYMLVYTY